MDNWIKEFHAVVAQNLRDLDLTTMGTPGALNILKKLPYRFDPKIPTISFSMARRRGWAACGEAAAAIAATEIQAGNDPVLCIKRGNLTKGAHALIISNSRKFDPYSLFFERANHACFLQFNVRTHLQGPNGVYNQLAAN